LASSTKSVTKLLTTIVETRSWRQAMPDSVALVPTMGALHTGHCQLIEKASELAEVVIVSIYVNPAQFGANEDFGSYPRTMEKDLDICTKLGVDAVFAPNDKEMYPEGKEHTSKIIVPTHLAEESYGRVRPVFFIGVATVCNKLFNILRPDTVIFGEKDYQQLLVIKKMVADLNMPITVYGHPTVREPDGLACSSRNIYLSQEERRLAPQIFENLTKIANNIKANPSNLSKELEEGKKLFEAIPGFSLQFLEARDAQTFFPVDQLKAKVVVLVAVKVGQAWLIDNICVELSAR
jgi:pantoate--beta-alanine ligase